ncbi:MAG: HEAT repeat domain-containing protein [Proteobacteria bacterium]|nr:HEAT repeat domain-containing protein [Pseudomonadota bacterium]
MGETMAVDERLFTYITNISFALISLSIIIILILAIRRSIIDRKIAYIENRKARLSKILNRYLDRPSKNPPKHLFDKASDYIIICKIMSEMLHVFNGKTRKNAMLLFNKMKMKRKLTKQLKSKNLNRRISAIKLLANWRSEDVGQLILEQLHDSNHLIQKCAIRSLANMALKSTLPSLITFFKSNYQRFSLLQIYDAFNRFGSIANPQLLDLIHQNNIPNNVKIAAIKAIADFGIASSSNSIIALHKDKNPAIRAAAYEALSKIGNSLPSYVIIKGLNDKDEQVRLWAVQCASHHFKPILIENLVKRLADKSWIIALKAAQSLYQSSRAGKTLLRKISKNSNLSGKRALGLLQEMQRGF